MNKNNNDASEKFTTPNIEQYSYYPDNNKYDWLKREIILHMCHLMIFFI